MAEEANRRRALFVIGLGLVALLALALVLLVRLERQALFPMPPAGEAVALEGRAEVVSLAGHGSPVEALYLAPVPEPATDSAPAPLLLFFHGNAELAEHWLDAFEEPRRRGWAALLVEYPGYGRCTGSPSEGSITAAARAAFEWASHDPRVDRDRIVAYGRSLGGAAAASLAGNHPLAALVLESSFTSVPEVAGIGGPARWLVVDRFDNLAALARHRGPLLVLHGRTDPVIPFAHGQRLAAAVPGARFVEMPCGHNDCPREWDEVLGVLDAGRGAATLPDTTAKKQP